MAQPGPIILIGSGETAATGGQVFEAAARAHASGASAGQRSSIHISVLETPAGFETNAQRVAGRVAEFMKVRLQNYQPEVQLIAARRKGTPFSPDTAEVVAPLYISDMIFFGPGSPTYTVRQLENSLAWNIIQARQRLGASLVLASAATISIGMLALPVYEIYKVGEDPHWKLGLNFFRAYGLPLIIVPHWNNREGGEEVDTSRCFIGLERFKALHSLLPANTRVIGIDEHTALTIDFAAENCQVRGAGQVHLLAGPDQADFTSGDSFSIRELGDYHPLRTPYAGIRPDVWQTAVQAATQPASQNAPGAVAENAAEGVPPEVQELVEARQEARRERDWARADEIRGQIASLGWVVNDTPAGPVIQHV